MKRYVYVLICICAALMICLTGCVDKAEGTTLEGLTLPTLSDGQMAVVVKGDGYECHTVTLTEDIRTCEDALDSLYEQGALDIRWSDTGYGKYIESVGGAVPGTGQWIAVYTDMEEYRDSGAYAVTYLVGERTLTSAKTGVSDLPARSGSVLYLDIAG